jgi:hypothetical protein
MKAAIMQPYFMPYIGYFQLIDAVDLFIIYDNIKYTKKGWINRNRILQNGKDVMVSLPLKAGSDTLQVCERELAADFAPIKFLAQVQGAYRKAPHFEATFALLERCLATDARNLFQFLHQALTQTCAHLGIATEFRVSSSIAIDHGLAAQGKVIALCQAVGADQYINPIGGVDLYAHSAFAEAGIHLDFLRAKPFEYPQFGAPFVPWLSILDVLMFNPVDMVRDQIQNGWEFA